MGRGGVNRRYARRQGGVKRREPSLFPPLTPSPGGTGWKKEDWVVRILCILIHDHAQNGISPDQLGQDGNFAFLLGNLKNQTII